MANFSAQTTIKTAGKTVSATASGNYNEVFNAIYSAPFGTSVTGSLQEAVQTHTITSAGYAQDLKYLLIKNIGQSTIELGFTIETWTDSAPDAHTSNSERFLRFMLPVGDYMLLPNIRLVDWGTEATGAGAGILNEGVAPAVNLYASLDTIAGADVQLTDGATTDSTDNITVDDATFFYPGDLVQLETEIVRVNEIKSSTLLKVTRGMNGSTAAAHNDNTLIRLPFFNAYHDYGDTSINGGGDGDGTALAKTDSNGRFKCQNMFGYARDVNYEADGLVPGSFSMQFRSEGGYQELGLSGITSSTNSGLTASTEYKFNITVDGGTEYADLAFTTDSSNLNFGGTNGIIRKIQDALDTQYYTTSSNLFERKVTVSIVNGDIRFSSHSNRSGTAISLAAPSTGTTPFGVGRIPAIGSISTAVPSRFPSRFSNKFDKAPITGGGTIVQNPKKDISSLCYDDGNGNILGAATGSIDYGSGAIDITDAPPNADFIFWMTYGAALSGGMKSTDDACNSIKEFRFRGINYNLGAQIEFIGMN